MEELNEVEELKKIQEKKNEIALSKKPISNITEQTEFSKTLDEAKINILREASAEDDKFVQELKNQLKEASIKSAKLENDKQELERKNVELNKNFIETKNQLEQHKQQENKWENKEKARRYHYEGLKDIMSFIHIENPMCIPIMYILAIIVSPIYLLYTLIIGPVATLIGGKNDGSRPKFVKGAIYTLLLIALAVALIFGIYAICHYSFGWF